MTKELTLKIILENPTAGVAYGIQKGKGSNYETIQKQISNSNDLHFELIIAVKRYEDNEPVFAGPLVQGASKDQFIYIDIGTYAGQENSCWSRRLKIPLKSISKDIIDKLSPGHVLLAVVQGTGKDGGPTCGTIKPFEGWKVV